MKKFLFLMIMTITLFSFLSSAITVVADETSSSSTSQINANIYTLGGGQSEDERVVLPPNPGLPIDVGAPAAINLRPSQSWNEGPLEKTGLENSSIFESRAVWSISQLRAVAQVEQPSPRILSILDNDRVSTASTLRKNQAPQKTMLPPHKSQRAKNIGLKYQSFSYWGGEAGVSHGLETNVRAKAIAKTAIDGSKKVVVIVGQKKLPDIQLVSRGRDTSEIVGKAVATAYTEPEEILAQITLRFVEEEGADGAILHSWGVEREQASQGTKKSLVPGVNWVTGMLGTVSIGSWSQHQENISFRSRVWVKALAVKYVSTAIPMPIVPVSESPKEDELEPIPFSIAFPFDSFRILPEESWKIKGFAEYIADNWEKVDSQGQFVFVGHADERGAHSYNDSLAMSRALMVHTQVVKVLESDYGFTRSQTSRIKFVSAGKYHTVFSGAQNKEEHQGNRQVYLVIVVPGIQGHNTPY